MKKALISILVMISVVCIIFLLLKPLQSQEVLASNELRQRNDEIFIQNISKMACHSQGHMFFD